MSLKEQSISCHKSSRVVIMTLKAEYFMSLSEQSSDISEVIWACQLLVKTKTFTCTDVVFQVFVSCLLTYTNMQNTCT